MSQCQECKAYKGHHPLCSLISVEEKAEQCEHYYKVWLRDSEHTRKRISYFSERITHWQGKFAILRQENNQLRNKLYRREKK